MFAPPVRQATARRPRAPLFEVLRPSSSALEDSRDYFPNRWNAVAGGAEAVVTGNVKDFRKGGLRFPHLAVLTPRQLIGE